jgi:TolB-like protein
MKKSWIVFTTLSLILFIFFLNPVQAQKKTTIAVLPFYVYSAENIEYVKQGIWDMLISRLSANEGVTVTAKEQVTEAMQLLKVKDMTIANVYAVGKKLNVDYVVWGSITKIGNSISIDGKLLDVAQYSSPVGILSQTQGMDEVIGKVNELAKKINEYLAGARDTTPGLQIPVAAPPTSPPVPKGEAVKGDKLVSTMRHGKRATLTGTINPDFITGAMPRDKKSFWMSQKYPTEFRGMDIGDVNGDGLNEIVTIDRNNIYIFQKIGQEMRLLQKIAGKSTDNYLGVDVFPLTGEKAQDIIVSNIFTSRGPNMFQHQVQSFVVSYRDGKWQRTADNLPWIFRAINNSGTPRLLGQKLSVSATSPASGFGPFDTPIYEMVWRGGKVAEGRKLKIPQGLSIYGLTIDNLGEGKDKIIALNKFDHILVLEETDRSLSKIESLFGGKEVLYRSEDVFGGSNLYLSMYGQEDLGDDFTEFNYYLNPRIITYDISKTGKREVFIAKNDAPSGRILKNVKFFTSTEFYCLLWDSIGLEENWRTKKLSGYAADYQIKDVDNDGEDEIVIALVTSSASLVSQNSVIVAYKLRASE